jgi:hypothetical protein
MTRRQGGTGRPFSPTAYAAAYRAKAARRARIKPRLGRKALRMARAIEEANLKAAADEDYTPLALAALRAIPPFTLAMLEAGATVEAEWDGRTFGALGRADKQRYMDRLAAAITAGIDAAIAEGTPST